MGMAQRWIGSGVAVMVLAGAGLVRGQDMRPVEVVLDGAEGVKGGSLRLSFSLPQGGVQARVVALEGGRGRLEVPAGATIWSDQGLFFDVPGYWVERLSPREVQAGEGAVHLLALPAGRVKGVVKGEEGALLGAGHGVMVTVAARPEGYPREHFLDVPAGPIEADGHYVLPALPVGGTYRLTAIGGGARLSATREVKVEKAGEEQVLDFVVKRGTDVAGVVLAPNGKPQAKAEVSLGYVECSMYFVASTDDAGRFSFKGVDFTLPGEWRFVVSPTDKTQGWMVRPLKEASAVARVQLKKGLEARGTLFDDTTGKPAAGKALFLTPGEKAVPGNFQVTTDAEGAFVFKGLQEAVYAVVVPGSYAAGTTLVRVNGRLLLKASAKPEVTPTVVGGALFGEEIHVAFPPEAGGVGGE